MLIETHGSHWLEKNLLLNQGFHCNSMTKICHLSVTRRCYGEPLASQVQTIYFPIGKISVEITSSENIANNFAEEWRFHTCINWNSVSYYCRVIINCLNEQAKLRSRIMILSHAFICNPNFRPKIWPETSRLNISVHAWNSTGLPKKTSFSATIYGFDKGGNNPYQSNITSTTN